MATFNPAKIKEVERLVEKGIEKFKEVEKRVEKQLEKFEKDKPKKPRDPHDDPFRKDKPSKRPGEKPDRKSDPERKPQKDRRRADREGYDDKGLIRLSSALAAVRSWYYGDASIEVGEGELKSWEGWKKIIIGMTEGLLAPAQQMDFQIDEVFDAIESRLRDLRLPDRPQGARGRFIPVSGKRGRPKKGTMPSGSKTIHHRE